MHSRATFLPAPGRVPRRGRQPGQVVVLPPQVDRSVARALDRENVSGAFAWLRERILFERYLDRRLFRKYIRGVTFTVRPTQLSRFVMGFRHDFINSVISNFAYQETVYASFVQQLVGRLALDLSGRYAYLNYQGNFVDPTQVGRRDNMFQVGASLDYFVRNWAYVGAGYCSWSTPAIFRSTAT